MFLRLPSTVVVLALASALPAPSLAKRARPIIDTHIHVYQVTRPGGVPWPPPANKVLYKDFTPPAYEAMARKHGFTGAVIVEASNIFDDNLKILSAIKGDPFFRGLVGNLEVGAADFVEKLDRLSQDPKLLGIRAFLWAPTLTVDETQVRHLEELARRGLSLDIISRGTLNPKDRVMKLADAVPDLRIIIDHLAGAKGKTPTPEWESAIRQLAARKNVYIKFSSFFDMYNPAATEDRPWKAPTALSAYKPHFDVLYDAFGPDRLIYGSNYPVVMLGGTLVDHVAIAEAYLATKGPEVRDKVMYRNAEAFYARVQQK